MIRFYPDEKFQQIEIDYPLQFKYAVSNRGRLISYKDEMQSGTLLKGGSVDGYKTLRYKMRKEGKVVDKQIFLYKVIAQFFIPKESEDQVHVLHLDYKRDHDDIKNLKWATTEERTAHINKSPHVKRSRENLLQHNLKSDGRKLSITKVMYLKKLLSDPNRKTRFKMLAKQFGVSEMQIRRIASGENWGYIKV